MGQNDSEEVVKLHHEVIEQAKYQGTIFYEFDLLTLLIK